MLQKYYLVIGILSILILGVGGIAFGSVFTKDLESSITTGSAIKLTGGEDFFERYNLVDNKILDSDGNILRSFCEEGCRLIYLMENGDYLAKTEDKFGRYSANGDLVWENEVKIHHELTETNEGTILALSQEIKEYDGRLCGFQNIIEYSSDGKEIYQWSVYDNFEQIRQLYPNSSQPERKNDKRPNKIKIECMEYSFHMNSVQAIPKDMHGDARFKKGNLLASLAGENLVVIIDKDTDKIVWSWGPEELSHQHMPRFLDNGNILVLDNGADKKFSRVIELNPLTKKIVWEYKADEPSDFFTSNRGSAQRLLNGNTLIGESVEGRAFEVTPNGEIVWELILSDEIINEKTNKSDFYRVTRITEEELDLYIR